MGSRRPRRGMCGSWSPRGARMALTATRISRCSSCPSPRPRMTRTSVAIVHDYLTQRGGAERVVLAMNRAFPDAPIYTSLYDPDGTYPEFATIDVRTAPLNRVPALCRYHRGAFPVLAPTFSAMNIDADVVVCSSSGWAHGVRTAGYKIVYCHAPARWLYQTDRYLAGHN